LQGLQGTKFLEYGNLSDLPQNPPVGLYYYAQDIDKMLFSGINGWNKVSSTPVIFTSGGTLTSDSTYYYRTFTDSGTFSILNGSLNVQILAIAGGGSGGYSSIGGGGAGGVVYQQTNLSHNSYNVIVGSGGSGGNAGSNSDVLNPSSNSVLSSPALGGGSYYQPNGGSGVGDGGLGTPGQGYNGGDNHDAGGGGAGGVGGEGYYSYGRPGGGNGGPGTHAYSDWASATNTGVNGGYAGGGGGCGVDYDYVGAVHGSATDGGGHGGLNYPWYFTYSQPGTANTGGGGGGTGGDPSYGVGSGGSGIVIIRYLKSDAGI